MDYVYSMIVVDSEEERMSENGFEKIVRIVRTIMLLLFAGAAGLYAENQGIVCEDSEIGMIVDDVNELNSGALLFFMEETGKYEKAPELSMKVEIGVTGIVSRTRLTQVFSNPHDEWLEATYVFPLPETASVDRLRLILADRIVEGKIMEKAEAKKVYEEAKDNGEQAALLEEQRPNMFVTSVANVPPKEKVTVEIEYLDTLSYDSGSCTIRFPLVITPRYNPDAGDARTREIDSAQRVMNLLGKQSSLKGGIGGSIRTFNDAVCGGPVLVRPLLFPGEGLRNPVDMRITLATGFELDDIASLYHPVRVTRTSAGMYEVVLSGGSVPADRDFVLVFKPGADGISDATCFVEEKNGSYYALVMVIPPPEEFALPRIRREVIFILDHSGSMYGASMTQAKDALAEALGRLANEDSFNLITFNDSYAAIFDECVDATEENRSGALRFVRSLAADGGTEMKRALQAALAMDHDSGRLRQIVFITDGAVSNEAELLSILETGLGEGRLFTVGIGSAPNSFFMKKAAEVGRGTCVYIGDSDEVKETMALLFRKLERPVLTDVKFSLADNAGEFVPSPVPDLYFGEPVVAVSKLAGPSGTIRLSGSYAGNGAIMSFFSKDMNIAAATRGSGVANLWASAKIDSLLDALYGGEKEDEVKPKVTALALEHGIVTPYTSLVAIERWKTKPKNESLRSVAVPLNPPHGSVVSQGYLGKAGTLSDLFVISGIVVFSIATVCFVFLRRRHHGKTE